MRIGRLLLLAGVAVAGRAQEAPRVIETPPAPPDPGVAEPPGPAKAQRVKLSTPRRSATAQTSDTLPRRSSSPTCALPAPSADAAVVVLALHQGQAVSNVALGSPTRVTSAIDVVVEPGRRPIYLLVASHDQLVVTMRGALAGVERVALMTRRGTDMGTVGIPRDRVSFADQRGCGLSWDAYKAPGGVDAPALTAALGRPPTVIGGAYASATAHVTDRNVVAQRAPRRPAAAGLRGEVQRMHPGGIRSFDAATVVASAPVMPYPVLPSTAGIEQLVTTSKLIKGSHADIEAWAEAAARRPGADVEAIAKVKRRAITFPAYTVRAGFPFPPGLCGGHAVAFIVPEGVPEPTGNRCHSMVLRPDGSAIW